MPLFGITQRRSLRPPVPKQVGRHSEIDGALFRKRWGTIPTPPKKCPTSPGIRKFHLVPALSKGPLAAHCC